MKFEGMNILEFGAFFPDDDSCKQYLADKKWSVGFACPRCKHDKFCESSDPFTRVCRKCKHTESSTAGTLFHKVKFGLRKAFHIVFEMSNTTKSMSSVQVSKRYGIRQATAWLFMQKVRLAMKSSGKNPMDGTVHVDEFVVGQKEAGKRGRTYDSSKSKVAIAVELTPDKKVKRVYMNKIEDYSSKSLKPLFENHISRTAQVLTDGWRGYTPLSGGWNMTVEESDPGKNFKELHVVVQTVKSWLRTIPGHVSKKHIQKYLDEFCYRINRSQAKETIFDNLVNKLVGHAPVCYSEIKCT